MHHKRKLHVVYIITKLELGGAQKVCLKLFNELPTSQISASLISGTEGLLAKDLKNYKNTFLIKDFVREISFENLVKEYNTFKQIIKKLRELKKQSPNLIVHTHSTKAGILGRWAAYCAGIKTRLHTVHGFGFHKHQSYFDWSIKFVLEWLTSFITSTYVCVSTEDIEQGLRLLPGFKGKHILIRAGVDETYFTPAIKIKKFHTPFTFGTIACFKPQKNLFDLLKAFEKTYLSNPSVSLEIIGDGLQRSAIENWIKTHNLQNQIRLLGWQQPVYPFLKTWDAFITTALWEGLPCAVVEARLAQLPVISYDTGGIKDIIENDVNGYIVEQQDIELFSNKMLLLTTNNQVQKRLSLYKDDLTNFKPTVMVKQHYLLYQSLSWIM